MNLNFPIIHRGYYWIEKFSAGFESALKCVEFMRMMDGDGQDRLMAKVVLVSSDSHNGVWEAVFPHGKSGCWKFRTIGTDDFLFRFIEPIALITVPPKPPTPEWHQQTIGVTVK